MPKSPLLNPQNRWYTCTKGIAEYRLGHFSQALPWLIGALDGQDSYRDAETELYLAMTSYKSGKVDEARAALADAVMLMEVIVGLLLHHRKKPR